MHCNLLHLCWDVHKSCAPLQQRVKAASSAEHMKVLAVDSSNADFHFQQLDKLRVVYEEYVKTGKELIPLAEKNLNQLNEELDQKNQALDDVILNFGIFWFNCLFFSESLSFSFYVAVLWKPSFSITVEVDGCLGDFNNIVPLVSGYFSNLCEAFLFMCSFAHKWYTYSGISLLLIRE